MESAYDVIVVGGGPAGLTAGMYAARRALKTLILTKDIGGQAATTPEIENYPGVDFADGFDLMEKFRAQAEKHGAEIRAMEVEGLEKQNDSFAVRTPHEQFFAKAVILAFGLTPRDLGVPGEERLKGRGVSSCVTCDGPLYKGKRVVVCGGSDHALDAAEFLAKIAAEVHIVYEREKFRGSAALVNKVMNDQTIAKHLGQHVVEIVGDDRVGAVVLGGSREETLAVDGVFVEVGYIANSKWLQGIIELDQRGHIIADKNGHTTLPGLFAAGDIASSDHKQAVISAGDGARAALEAYRYIHHAEGKPIIPDWGFTKE